MADSANCLPSIISGSPSAAEKSVRISLPYIGGLWGVLTLTFIDRNYNPPDAPTKRKDGIAQSYYRPFDGWSLELASHAARK